MIVPSRIHAAARKARPGEPDWRSHILGIGAFLVLAAACFYILALSGR